MKNLKKKIKIFSTFLCFGCLCLSTNLKTTTENKLTNNSLVETKKEIAKIKKNYECDEYLDEEKNNDPLHAQVVNDYSGRIIGKISKSGKKIDQDWFKFKTKQCRKYSFDLTMPNDSHYIEIYKSETGENSIDQLKSIRKIDQYNSYYVNLMPGTYFLKITCSNLAAVSTLRTYDIYYRDSKVDDKLQLNEETKLKYRTAIWESDFIPTNVKRWDGSSCLFHSFSVNASGNNATINHNGDGDPIFVWANGQNRYLDSVIYVWGKNEIKDLLTMLQKVDGKLRSDFNNDTKLSATASFKEDAWGFVISLVGDITETTIPFISSCCTVFGYATAIASIFSSIFSGVNPAMYKRDLGIFVTQIMDAAYWVSEYNIDAVLCIPRYSYHSFSSSASGATGSSSASASTADYWNFTYAIDDDVYKPFYDFKESFISSYQTYNYNNSSETLHGKITPFKNGRELCEYTGIDYDEIIGDRPEIPDFADTLNDEPLYERKLEFNRKNNFTDYAKIKFNYSGSTLFFTRGEVGTKIEIFDEGLNILHASKRGGGYKDNAFFSFNVDANYTYLIKISMLSESQYGKDWACLTVIQAMTYIDNFIFDEPHQYSDLGQIIGVPFEGFFEFAQNKSTVVSFVPEFTGGYLFSTHYAENHHLIPISLGDYGTWEYYHSSGSGTLYADYVDLFEGVPCLIVVARDNRSAEVPPSGSLHSFGMLIDSRYVEGES